MPRCVAPLWHLLQGSRRSDVSTQHEQRRSPERQDNHCDRAVPAVCRSPARPLAAGEPGDSGELTCCFRVLLVARSLKGLLALQANPGRCRTRVLALSYHCRRPARPSRALACPAAASAPTLSVSREESTKLSSGRRRRASVRPGGPSQSRGQARGRPVVSDCPSGAGMRPRDPREVFSADLERNAPRFAT